MKLLTILFLSILICSNSFAYQAPVFFSTKEYFTIDGYDFVKDSFKDNPETFFFPIVEKKQYDLTEVGEEQLTGGSYRKLFCITNPDTLQSAIFNTEEYKDKITFIVSMEIFIL